jgi:DNA-binding NarL/FixJ family response regulator
MDLRVGIVDDHEIFRRGLASVLADERMIRIAFAGSRAAVDRIDWDVAVLSWESIEGLELGCPAVVLAPGGSVNVDRLARLAGSNSIAAVLPRRSLTAERVVVAVRAAAAGLRTDAELESQAVPDTVLDERRTEVLRLLALGENTRTIAEKVSYSERTVKTLIHDIELRLGAQTRAQAVAEGLRLGVI